VYKELDKTGGRNSPDTMYIWYDINSHTHGTIRVGSLQLLDIDILLS
jgi:hypothetical protein